MVLQLEFLGRRVANTQLFPTQTKYRDLLISIARQISTCNNIHNLNFLGSLPELLGVKATFGTIHMLMLIHKRMNSIFLLTI